MFDPQTADWSKFCANCVYDHFMDHVREKQQARPWPPDFGAILLGMQLQQEAQAKAGSFADIAMMSSPWYERPPADYRKKAAKVCGEDV